MHKNKAKLYISLEHSEVEVELFRAVTGEVHAVSLHQFCLMTIDFKMTVVILV